MSRTLVHWLIVGKPRRHLVQISVLTLRLTPKQNFPTSKSRIWSSHMQVGTVKWFNDAKGFGFIEPEQGGPDVFAHFSAIEMGGFRTLKQGAKVAFELVVGPKGNLAQSIRQLVPEETSA